MVRGFSKVIISFVFIFSIFCPNTIPAKSDSPIHHTLTNLTPSWFTGTITEDTGPIDILLRDFNQDGIIDIASCGSGYIFFINYLSPGNYALSWYSEYMDCHRIDAADRDSNGIPELYVLTSDRRVLIYQAEPFKSFGTITLPEGTTANDIEIANVDADADLEILVATTSDTFIYNANSLALEWQANGWGGNQIRAGNIDSDPTIELIVNGNPAYILDPVQKNLEWSYSGGFGVDIGIGDVDGDNMEEIAWIQVNINAYVMDGDTKTIKWQRNDLGGMGSVEISDVNKDGIGEVIIGDYRVLGFQGVDGTLLWSIPFQASSVFQIITGDVNADGVNEIVWSAGSSNYDFDYIFVGNWLTQSVEWKNDNLNGFFYSAAGDVDQDGQAELVMATYSENVHGTLVRSFEGLNHQVKWSTAISSGNYTDLKVGQLDSDPALEIVIGMMYYNYARLQTIDGSSGALEWRSTSLSSVPFHGMTVGNLDADAADEIVVGFDSKHVNVFDGGSNTVVWDSGKMDDWIVDLAVGDLDGNGIMELAILTRKSVTVFEAGTWTQKYHQFTSNGSQVAFANSDLQGPGELLLIYDSGRRLEAHDGVKHELLWQRTFNTSYIKDLVVGDFDTDGSQEFAIVGCEGEYYSKPSILWIGSQSYPFIWEAQLGGNWGTIISLANADLDMDGQQEVVIGSERFIKQYEVTGSTRDIYSLYTPLTRKLGGIYGKVTEKGIPVSDVALELRYFDGNSWSTRSTTLTGANGHYSFNNIPSLAAGQRYYVRFQNSTSGNPNRLWTWHTRTITSYTEGSELPIGEFDIANIGLVSPENGLNVRLPKAFEWTPRFATPSDSYEFNLYDFATGYPWFYTDPPLGYVNRYVLNGLPPGFTYTSYSWEIWAYSPDGGYGISFETRSLYFER